ncbi:hypothetical protein [Schauerella aestuarii]|uniref:hypothetical protein n=1 Tax=Schauerella aestuarii TaxID=2511204 RepID=UPI00136C1B30|nr:hypothetical protein [Achromobacter aestuarii]MYZ41430.1 hypothetical protein [Achromobacter aestuarii]
MHWSDKYVGEPYVPGVGDCASLAAKVGREVLGIACGLPEVHATGLRNQATQIYEHKDVLAGRVDKPIDGQPALFVGRGRVCHIGVCCLIAGETWILHADQTVGFVVRQRLREMTRIHYQLEGFYRWT